MNYDEKAKVASITGHIVLTDGSRSEFVIGTVSGEPYWSQWGGVSNERLSCTVDVMDAMKDAVVEYLVDDDMDDDKCSECGAGLDDGEGYNGLCGNCADKSDEGWED